MISIKGIRPDGEEFLLEGKSVVFEPAQMECSSPRNARLTLCMADDSPSIFMEGKFFVMNRFGATIAQYNLPALNPQNPLPNRPAPSSGNG